MTGPTDDGVPTGSPTGSLAEEAARLAAAAQEWLRTATGPAAGPGSATGPADRPGDAAGPVDATGPCRYCPVCQLAAALRDGHPELVDRVGELTAALLAAVHAAFESATAPSGSPRSPVQHIRVDGQESM